MLHGDSSLLAMEMSESSITELNEVAGKFYRPQLGHFRRQEDLSNTERRIVSLLTQSAWYQVLHDSVRMADMASL